MHKIVRTLMGAGFILTLVVSVFFSNPAWSLEGKAGEVIKTEADLKQLYDKGLLTEVYLMTFKELTNNGVSIPIVETTDRSDCFSNTYKAVTEQNKGTATLTPDGSIKNFKGGAPFPDVKANDPQAGNKAAHNWDNRGEGDNSETYWKYYLTDNNGNVRTLGGLYRRIKWSFRTDMDPKPEIQPGNPDGIKDKDFTLFYEPFASKGLVVMAVRYLDPKKDKDNFIYVPGLRRTTRAGGGNKCDCVGGFVHNMDDNNSFSGDPAEYTYKLLGVKKLLMPWQPDIPPASIVPIKMGLHIVSPKLELREVWIVEATAKDKNYCYSKRVWYMDPQSWFWILNCEHYDKQGKIWKTQWLPLGKYRNSPSTGGGFIQANTAGTIWDLKINEAGPYHIVDSRGQNIDIKPDEFTLDNLRRMGR